MTVSELQEKLRYVNDQDATVIICDEDCNIFQDRGCNIGKIVEVICDEDEDISNVYLITD